MFRREVVALTFQASPALLKHHDHGTVARLLCWGCSAHSIPPTIMSGVPVSRLAVARSRRN